MVILRSCGLEYIIAVIYPALLVFMSLRRSCSIALPKALSVIELLPAFILIFPVSTADTDASTPQLFDRTTKGALSATELVVRLLWGS